MTSYLVAAIGQSILLNCSVKTKMRNNSCWNSFLARMIHGHSGSFLKERVLDWEQKMSLSMWVVHAQFILPFLCACISLSNVEVHGLYTLQYPYTSLEIFWNEEYLCSFSHWSESLALKECVRKYIAKQGNWAHWCSNFLVDWEMKHGCLYWRCT